MVSTRTGLTVAASLVLGACGGGQAGRDEAAIAEACKADGKSPAPVCECTAAKLREILEPESLSAMAEFVQALGEAAGEDAKRLLFMGVVSNPKLVVAMEKTATIEKQCIAEAGGKPGSVTARDAAARKLSGTYVPQLGDVDAGSRRLAAAAADRRWEFSDDGTVVTHSQRGPVKWAYEVRGKEIRLRGVDGNNRGESRRFTYTQDGRCIWDGSGRSSVDMRFCPQ